MDDLNKLLSEITDKNPTQWDCNLISTLAKKIKDNRNNKIKIIPESDPAYATDWGMPDNE